MIASLICFYNHERIQLATKMTSKECFKQGKEPKVYAK